MLLRATTILVAVLLFLTPAPSRADLVPYSQDFEGLVQSNPAALAGDGWLVYGNVFSPTWTHLYGYGPFPAPNGGPGFSGIDIGQGGPDQGAQQLVVYNNYDGPEHANGNLVEANVFQEEFIGAADAGAIWVFEFDAKRGNIEGTTTALAFIKTLDPNQGYATTNFLTTDMTSVPGTWGRYSVSITIDAGLVGQILQFGFASTTTAYQGSGIFYDNLSFRRFVPTAATIAPKTLNARSSAPSVAVSIELTGFDPFDIDIATLRLAGTIAPELKSVVVGDRDGDLVPDLTVRFSYPALRALLPTGPNEIELTGSLITGESFSAILSVKVIDPHGGQAAASVSPNPLNPAGVLSFRTSRQGPVSVRMFDLNGRLVRTLLDRQTMPAGSHGVSIDGRGRGGESLPSGVYFYRVETPDGTARGQFSILK